MDLKHTIQDVADYAGVSKATVSKVINNSGYVGKTRVTFYIFVR